MTDNDTRQNILRKVRKAIQKYGYTARELSIPPEVDLIMMLLALDEFPYKMGYTKLAIICFIGSRGSTTRSLLQELLSKDHSTISHNLIDLENYGFISSIIEPTGKRQARVRRYSLTLSGERVFKNFLTYYQQKIIQTQSILYPSDVDSAAY